MNLNEKVWIVDMVLEDGTRAQVMALPSEVKSGKVPVTGRSFICENGHTTMMTPTISKAYDKHAVPCMICKKFAYEEKAS
jgi:hypothetical protein